MTDFFKIETLSQMLKFKDLPAPKHPLITFIDFSDTQFTKALPANKVVCDFYQISLKSDSEGFLKYGRETYDYQEESLVYIAPGQVVEYPPIEGNLVNNGWTLFFHADLIRSFTLDNKMKDYDFFNYHANEALHISEKEKDVITSIVEKIQIELNSNLEDFSEEVIVNNLELLLNYSKRFYNRQFITRKRFDTDVIVRLTDLLDQYFDKGLQKEMGIPTVQYFAKKLNYSSNYLNGVIRKATDKSVLEHIQYKVIELAKSRLLNSDKSVSEIAFALGFEYSQYFSRLSKKKTGQTPKQYRKAS